MSATQPQRLNTANGYEVDLIPDGDELRIDLRGTASWWTSADLDRLIAALQVMRAQMPKARADG